MGVDLNQKFRAHSTELQNSNPFSETVSTSPSDLQVPCIHSRFFPRILHNKPAVHNCPIIATLYGNDSILCITDRLWKAGLLLKNSRKNPAV